jgi:Flp pilus assembly protein TadD
MPKTVYFARSLKATLTALAIGCGVLTGCASAPARSGGQTTGEAVTTNADELGAKAAEARAKGDLDLALKLYVQRAELDPTDADALFEIGAIYEFRGDAPLAARAYARAVQIEPQHSRALEGLGLRYFAERQLDDARPLLQRAVDADNTLWRSHNALGLIADALGRHSEAGGHYAAALALRPGSAAILNNRGYSQYLAGALDAAERDFRAALAAEPGYDKAWQNLGLIFARRRDYAAALAALERVVAEHVAANDVGYIAMLSGDFGTAERLFAEAIRLSPRFYQTANDNAAELRRRRTATLTTQ